MHTLLDSAESWLHPMALLSWKGTLFAVVVGLALLLLRRHLSPAWRHGLWLLVLMRFILPDLGTSSLSIAGITAPVTLQQAATPSPDTPLPPDFAPDLPPPPTLTPQDLTPVSAITSPAAPSIATAPPSADVAAASAWTLAQVLTLLWLTGAASVLGLMVLLHVRLHLRIRRDAAPASPAAASILQEACHLAHVTRVPRLILTDAVRAPSLFGLFRPVILLPKALAEEETPAALKLIFLHELAHSKRWDLAAQIIASLAIALHWYNPAVWWAGRRLRAEAEMAADAKALRCTGGTEAHRMGELLLGFAHHAAAAWILSFLAVSQMGISGSSRDLRRRIEALMDIARGRSTRGFVGLGAFFLLALMGLTTVPAQDAPKPSAPASATKLATPPAAVPTSLSGRVEDSQGQPIAGATCLLRIGADQDFEQRKLVSDSEGRFKFEGLTGPGPLRAWARHPGYLETTQPAPDLTAQDIADLRLVLQPVKSWLSGTITRKSDGRPLQGATVYLTTGTTAKLPPLSWLSLTPAQAETDEAGHYRLPRLKDEPQAAVAVEAPGLMLMTAKFDWADGEMTQDLALAPDPGVSGKVVSAGGAPVEGASLSLFTGYYSHNLNSITPRKGDRHYSPGRGYWLGSPVTDASGAFAGRLFQEEPTTEPWIVAYHADHGIQAVPLKDWKNGGTITLEKWRTLHGTLLDGGGKPVKNKEIKVLQMHLLRESTGPGRPSLSNHSSCVTDDQGHYRLERLLPRSSTLSAQVDDQYIQMPTAGWLPGTTLEHTLRMRQKDPVLPAGQLRHVKGRVLLPSAKASLPDHEIRINIGLVGNVGGQRLSEPDSEGRFTSNMLPPGLYELRMWAEPRDRQLTLPANTGLTKRFTLEPAGNKPLDLGDFTLDAADFVFPPRTASASSSPPPSTRRQQQVEVELAPLHGFETWSGCGGSETSAEQKFTPQGGIVGTVPASSNGRFMLRATKEDGTRYFSAAQLVTPEGQEVFKGKLAFTPGVVVEGALQDLPKGHVGEGWVVASVRVSVEAALDTIHKGGLPVLIWHSWAPVRKDGSFRFHGLPRGSLELTAMGDGWVSRHPNGFSTDVTANLVTAGPLLKVAIGTQPSLKGRVRLLRPDGTPAAGATISLYPSSLSNIGRALGRWSYATEQADAKVYAAYNKQKTAGHFATADADGYASLHNLPQDNLTFEVTWMDSKTKDRQVERANLRLNVPTPQIQLQGKQP